MAIGERIHFFRLLRGMTQKYLGMALGVSYKTIRRHIKAMGNVHYIGRGFSGHWEIHDKS